MKRCIRMEWRYSQYYKIGTHKHPDTREDNVYIYQNTGWGNLILFFSPTCLRSVWRSVAVLLIFFFFLIRTINEGIKKTTKKQLKQNKDLLACALIIFSFFFFKIWFLTFNCALEGPNKAKKKTRTRKGQQTLATVDEHGFKWNRFIGGAKAELLAQPCRAERL